MRVRKLGTGALTWGAGTISGGEEGDAPPEVVRAYAHKLLILDPAPAPEPLPPPASIDVGGSIREVLEAVDAGRLTPHDALEAERAGRARVTLIRELEERCATSHA